MNQKKHKNPPFTLPKNFQEEVILKEMKFLHNKAGIDIVRELLYLYSLGIEYYDSIGCLELYTYYSTKNNELLMNPKVTEIFENFDTNTAISQDNSTKKIQTDIIPDIEIDQRYLKLFKKNSLILNCSPNKFRCPDDNEDHSSTKDITALKLRKTSIFNNQCKNRKAKEDEAIIEVNIELSKLEQKLSFVQNLIEMDIQSQVKLFEKRKLEKKLKQGYQKRKINRKGSKLDTLSINTIKGQINNEIQSGMIDLSQINVLAILILMSKEIEDYIGNNEREMNKSLEELRISYEEDLKTEDVQENPGRISALKEDYQIEADRMKCLYEEQKEREIEKIRVKYYQKIQL